MVGDLSFDFCVEFTSEQLDVAWNTVKRAPMNQRLLVQDENSAVNFDETFENVLHAGCHAYLSVLLMQAKREQRGLIGHSSDLARQRRKILSTIATLRGIAPTSDDVLTAAASYVGLDPDDLKPLEDPIGQDLSRLQVGFL